ncbi:hypothetical protein [Leptospira noguchii]|uniref:Uncharacterized protein n=1 Tax=Leptospira noguchii TaxID=28182 RepID=A0AAE9GHB4_9LEPT|nr:hypothetical protein [Leptospira noguchii]UOG55870.1 hypothetical protein MAL03_13520 [Leptospira noguchii]
METQHNALYGSRWKLNTTLSMDRVVGWDSVLQRICRNSHRFNIEIQILVGLVMGSLWVAAGITQCHGSLWVAAAGIEAESIN